MANPESLFQKKVLHRLRQEKDIFVFTKEAKSIRGLPDIIGCCNGLFFGWELKASESEARKRTGRIALQRHILKLIQRAGGVGEIVHPKNLDDKLTELLQAARKSS